MAGNIIAIQGAEELKNGVHYEVDIDEQPLGEGATGTVRRGWYVDEKTGLRKEVAIKFLFEDLSEDAIIRSRREASIHIVNENLIEMLGFVQVGEKDLYGKTQVHYHVVSELLKGVMLLDFLRGSIEDKDGTVYPEIKSLYEMYQQNNDKFALFVVRSVLSGIMALHDNGYIHRDIDPSNIMITDQGKIKLIDLGIAKKTNTLAGGNEMHLTSNGEFIGKAAYAAPELVRGDIAHQDETTDIYAIGILLYLMVVGQLPFVGPLHEVLGMQCNSKMPLKNIKNGNIREIVRKATMKKQSERYQSASEFRVALDNINTDSAAGGGGVPSWVVYAVVVVLGIAMGAALGFLL